MDFYFDDTFSVKEVDPEGKKFDRVSRVRCKSENYEVDMLLDIASDIYPLRKEERFHCVLSPTLQPMSTSKGGSALASYREELQYDPSKGTGPLADKFDYVMYGKVFKAEDTPGTRMAVYVSFGGLLMRIEGEPRHWHDLSVGSFLYILLKKTN